MSAGALDSPKLLLLSGIGPETESSKFQIPLVVDLPGVGQNLCDRLFLELVSIRKAGNHHRTSYITSPDTLEAARKQWKKDKSGPLTGYFLPQMIGYFKNDKMIQSEEFQGLDTGLQRAFTAETKPHLEIISVRSSAFLDPAPLSHAQTLLLSIRPALFSIIKALQCKLPISISQWPWHSKGTTVLGDP